MDDVIIRRSAVWTSAITLSLQLSHPILAEMVVLAADARHSSACNGNVWASYHPVNSTALQVAYACHLPQHHSTKATQLWPAQKHDDKLPLCHAWVQGCKVLQHSRWWSCWLCISTIAFVGVQELPLSILLLLQTLSQLCISFFFRLWCCPCIKRWLQSLQHDK